MGVEDDENDYPATRDGMKGSSEVGCCGTAVRKGRSFCSSREEENQKVLKPRSKTGAALLGPVPKGGCLSELWV